MENINERLDRLKNTIQDSDFLEGKGLSNEVNIRIFCYAPQDEMTVRHFIKQLCEDKGLRCNLIECNLFKIFPFMRVHVLLEALQPHFSDIPILVMYPGEYDGHYLKLFKKLPANDYYRAFSLV